MLFHEIVDGEPESDTQFGLEDFIQLIDYVPELRIETLTFHEWYIGLTNPRFREKMPSRNLVTNRTSVKRRSINKIFKY